MENKEALLEQARLLVEKIRSFRPEKDMIKAERELYALIDTLSR